MELLAFGRDSMDTRERAVHASCLYLANATHIAQFLIVYCVFNGGWQWQTSQFTVLCVRIRHWFQPGQPQTLPIPCGKCVSWKGMTRTHRFMHRYRRAEKLPSLVTCNSLGAAPPIKVWCAFRNVSPEQSSDRITGLKTAYQTVWGRIAHAFMVISASLVCVTCSRRPLGVSSLRQLLRHQ
jgi:hypothetical protein